jgi:hypothetical protein
VAGLPEADDVSEHDWDAWREDDDEAREQDTDEFAAVEPAVGQFGGSYRMTAERAVIHREANGWRIWWEDVKYPAVRSPDTWHRWRWRAEAKGLGWGRMLRRRWLFVKHPVSWWRGRA